jgi:crotonobetainyl-CoA hydratase
VSDVLTYSVDGPVATLTLNRPAELNAVTVEICDAMVDALAAFEADPTARVAILTGAGRAFCAGADLKAFAAGDGPKVAGHRGGFGGFVRYPRTKPVIAAINGHALAGGLELVIACELAVASSAARFGVPEPTVGLMAGGGGAVRLPRQMGAKAAMQLLLTGQPIDAHRALALGLVNTIVDPERVHEVAAELAEKICRTAPMSAAATLKVARHARSGAPEDEVWRVNDVALVELFASEDAAEGMRAFTEKREPLWQGAELPRRGTTPPENIWPIERPSV